MEHQAADCKKHNENVGSSKFFTLEPMMVNMNVSNSGETSGTGGSLEVIQNDGDMRVTPEVNQ